MHMVQVMESTVNLAVAQNFGLNYIIEKWIDTFENLHQMVAQDVL